jgi:hypothetical protein
MRLRPYLALVLAVLLGAGAFVTGRPVYKFVRSAQQATAKVGQVYDCPEPSRLGVSECAATSFTTVSGRQVIATLRGWPGRFERGEQREVLYDPMDPERARLDSLISLWTVPALFAVAAALVLIRGTVGMGRG